MSRKTRPGFEGEEKINDDEILRTLRGIGRPWDFEDRRTRVIELLEELREIKMRLRDAANS